MKEPIKPHAVYTTEEAAKLLGLNIATIQSYIRKEKIRATKIGGKWYRILGRDLLDFMGKEHVEFASLDLECELVALDLGHDPRAGIVADNSPFYNVSTSVLNRIAKEAPDRATMLRQIAEFIRKFRKNRKK